MGLIFPVSGRWKKSQATRFRDLLGNSFRRSVLGSGGLVERGAAAKYDEWLLPVELLSLRCFKSMHVTEVS